MSLLWDSGGCISRWQIKTDQDHHQNPYNPLYRKGNHVRSSISVHTLGVTETTFSLKKRFEKISGRTKTLQLGKWIYGASPEEPHSITPQSILSCRHSSNTVSFKEDKHPLTFKFMNIFKPLLTLVEGIKKIT